MNLDRFPRDCQSGTNAGWSPLYLNTVAIQPSTDSSDDPCPKSNDRTDTLVRPLCMETLKGTIFADKGRAASPDCVDSLVYLTIFDAGALGWSATRAITEY